MTETIHSHLHKLKWEFYEWCSLLSLDEATSNKELLDLIARVERMMITVGG